MTIKRIERAVRRLGRVARQAVAAQERYDYWTQFGTNSVRARRAETARDGALAALENAETDAEEVLLQLSIEGL